MMRLAKCYFEGLPGFPVLELKDLGAVTALIGPNGAGKSSILQVLSFAITLLNKKTIFDVLPEHDTWQKFSFARLSFQCDENGTISHLTEHFGKDYKDVEFEIECNEKVFFIRKITCNNNAIEFARPSSTKAMLIEMEFKLRQTSDQLATMQSDHQRQRSQATIAQLIQAREKQEINLLKAQEISAKIATRSAAVRLTRNDADTFIIDFDLPALAYVSARQSPEVAIPELISQLMLLKKGRKPQSAEYHNVVARLNHLLQADVDLSEVEGKECLHIDGVPYSKASSGTEITLSFFGLTRLEKPNCIVLWDEPENGLHPTRR